MLNYKETKMDDLQAWLDLIEYLWEQLIDWFLGLFDWVEEDERLFVIVLFAVVVIFGVMSLLDTLKQRKMENE